MWNDLRTDACEGMIAETVQIPHGNGSIRAYYSRPLYAKNAGSIVLIPHMPGWDEWCRETARRFTQHGYAVLCPDIYRAFGVQPLATIPEGKITGFGKSGKYTEQENSKKSLLRKDGKSNTKKHG